MLETLLGTLRNKRETKRLSIEFIYVSIWFDFGLTLCLLKTYQYSTYGSEIRHTSSWLGEKRGGEIIYRCRVQE